MSYNHFRVFWVFRGLKIFVRFVGPGKNRRFPETGGKKVIFEEKRRPDCSARPCGNLDSDVSAQLICMFRVFRVLDLNFQKIKKS